MSVTRIAEAVGDQFVELRAVAVVPVARVEPSEAREPSRSEGSFDAVRAQGASRAPGFGFTVPVQAMRRSGLTPRASSLVELGDAN